MEEKNKCRALNKYEGKGVGVLLPVDFQKMYETLNRKYQDNNVDEMSSWKGLEESIIKDSILAYSEINSLNRIINLLLFFIVVLLVIIAYLLSH